MPRDLAASRLRGLLRLERRTGRAPGCQEPVNLWEGEWSVFKEFGLTPGGSG